MDLPTHDKSERGYCCTESARDTGPSEATRGPSERPVQDARGLRNPVYFRFILTVDNRTAERFARLDGRLAERVRATP
jgi:hypothetical protein